jgi:hypothetical protein
MATDVSYYNTITEQNVKTIYSTPEKTESHTQPSYSKSDKKGFVKILKNMFK